MTHFTSHRTSQRRTRAHLATVVGAALGAAATSLAACGPPPEQPDPRPIVGCHYFVQDAAARELSLPWGVRLLDQSLEGWPAIQQRGDVRLATTLTGHSEENFPFGYWLRTAEDSVEIGYPAGGGLVLALAIDNGELVGTARPVGDALAFPADPPERRTHPVRLTWAGCPEQGQ